MNDYEIKKLYEEMELHLISSMKRNLGRHLAEENKVGFKFTQWQAEKLKELKRYQKENQRIIGRYTLGLDEDVSEHLQNELKKGAISAIKQYNEVLGENLIPSKIMNKSFFQTNDKKVDALIKVVNNDLKTANTSALRMVNDQYRQIIHKSAFFVGNGVFTEKQAAAQATQELSEQKMATLALDEASNPFLAGGLNCIEYKDGRRVNIASYAQMAIRTASLRSHLMGEGDFRKSIGRTLVKVTTHGGACPLCVKWQGKVLIDDVYSGGTSKDGNYTLLSDAMKQGFLHPNCRHGVTTYYPELEEDDDEKVLVDENELMLQDKINYTTRNIKRFGRLWRGLFNRKNVRTNVIKEKMQKEELNKLYAEKWGIKNTYLDDLDEGVVKEIDQSVTYNFNKYPKLKDEVKSIGSIQSKNKHKFKEIKEYYEELLELNNPEMNAELKEKLSVDYAKEKLPRARKDTYAISVKHRRDRFQLNGIYVHNKYGSDYGVFKEHVIKDVKDKFHPVGTDNIKAVIDHEFGHQLNNLLDLENNEKILKIYNSLTKRDVYMNLSQYANKNIEEFISECYSEYVNNPNCRGIAKEVGDIIDEIYYNKFK